MLNGSTAPAGNYDTYLLSWLNILILLKVNTGMRILFACLCLIAGPLMGQMQIRIEQTGYGKTHGINLFVNELFMPVNPSGDVLLDTVLNMEGPVRGIAVNKAGRYAEIWLDAGNNRVLVNKKGFPASTEVEGSETYRLFKQLRYGEDQEARQQLVEKNADNPMVLHFVNQYSRLLDSTFLARLYREYSPEQQAKLADVRAYLFPIDSPTPKEGAPLYDFVAKDRDGVRHDTRDYRGKYLLIDFAATGCGPCWEGYPDLMRITSEFENLQVLTFNEDDEKSGWQRIADRRNLTFDWPILWDHEKKEELFRLYEINGWPTFLLVSPEGIILEKWMGSQESSLRSALGRHLGK